MKGVAWLILFWTCISFFLCQQQVAGITPDNQGNDEAKGTPMRSVSVKHDEMPAELLISIGDELECTQETDSSSSSSNCESENSDLSTRLVVDRWLGNRSGERAWESYNKLELGQSILVPGVVLSIGALSLHPPPDPIVFHLILILVIVGFALLLFGLLLRNLYSRFAAGIELFGLAIVIGTASGIACAELPPYLAWIPIIFWISVVAFCVLAFTGSRQSHLKD